MPNHREIHNAYLSSHQQVLDSAGLVALVHANNLLKTAKIYGKIKQMEHLDTLYRQGERQVSQCDEEFDSGFSSMMRIGAKRSDCYNGLSDDVIIFAAMSNYISSYLLRHGYLVHKINQSDSLAKHQQTRPIHISEISSSTSFCDGTLSASTLTSDNYLEVLKVDENLKRGLEQLRVRAQLGQFDLQLGERAYYQDNFFATFHFIQQLIEQDHSQSFDLKQH